MARVAEPVMQQGTIRTLQQDKGYGFILGDDGAEYFFHRSGALDFGALARGATVRFEPTVGQKGPRAEKVELLG